MVRADVLRKRLQKLDEYLTILHSLRIYSLDEFLADPKCYGSAERFLQLAIEAINDMGNHIIADLRQQHGYIAGKVAAHWRKMIGFRNILVHDYLDINRAVVYDVLQHGLDDFEAIKECLTRFL